jgi:hypothetical protein
MISAVLFTRTVKPLFDLFRLTLLTLRSVDEPEARC